MITVCRIPVQAWSLEQPPLAPGEVPWFEHVEMMHLWDVPGDFEAQYTSHTSHTADNTPPPRGTGSYQPAFETAPWRNEPNV